MPRISRRLDTYPYAELLIDSTDLRGVNLTGAILHGVDLTGCLRNEDDPAIARWTVVDGVLRYQCGDCDEIIAFDECGYCHDCCNHATCPACEEHNPSRVCSHCDHCSSCCDCIFCSHCSDAVESTCNDCDQCNDCCSCRRDDEVDLYSEGAPRPHKPGDAFTCKRLVGVEWEHNRPIDAYQLHRKHGVGYHKDGSCAEDGHEYGYEAVTPPLAGDAIAECLNAIAGAFEDQDTTADEQCGIHVHVDAKDLRWADMYRLLWVYSRVEPVLYVLAGQQRVANTYCRPCGEPYRAALADIDRKGAVLAVALQDRFGRIYDEYGSAADLKAVTRKRIDKKHYGRYKGLNILPWIAGRRHKKQGYYDPKGNYRERSIPRTAPDTTVEFRIHRNTLDADRVIHWAQLCARLVDWCARASDAEAQALPRSALRALCAIAPDLAPWIMKRVRAWRARTTQGPTRGGLYRRRIVVKGGMWQCAA